MKKLVVGLTVLGCYGLMVGAASAGERWPGNVCKDVQEELVALERMHAKAFASIDKVAAATHLGNARATSLYQLQYHCGGTGGAAAKLAYDNAMAAAEEVQTGKAAAQHPRSAPAPRAPVLCDTTPKAYGGSTTDCF